MPAHTAVLFDFSGTLFHIESARDAVVAALGEQAAGWAPELERLGAINGSGTPEDLPAHLAGVWERRDLARDAHRAAYSGLSVHAGLSAEQAHLVYERGLTAEAWQPFPDTVAVLRRLRADGIPVAMISNIGWDPEPVLRAHGVDGLLDALVLSDRFGATKPDPAIFRHACALLGVDPHGTLMVGDNAHADGAATAVGCRFVLVPPDATRPPDTLMRAVYGDGDGA